MCAARFFHATVPVRRAFCSAHMAWRVAENAHLPSQALAHCVAFSAALIKSQMLCAEARSKKQPAAHLCAMRASVRVKTLGTQA